MFTFIIICIFTYLLKKVFTVARRLMTVYSNVSPSRLKFTKQAVCKLFTLKATRVLHSVERIEMSQRRNELKPVSRHGKWFPVQTTERDTVTSGSLSPFVCMCVCLCYIEIREMQCVKTVFKYIIEFIFDEGDIFSGTFYADYDFLSQ